MAIPQTTAKPAPTTELGANFRLVDGNIKRRMIISVEGDWGSGKTDLALTAPGPIAFFKFDLNADFTLSQWATKKQIYKCEYEVPDSSANNAQALADALWSDFKRDYERAIHSPKVRTVVWDTGTEVWEMCRLAAFGKLTNVMPHHYVQVNNGFRALIKQAFDSDTNLIMVHRMKDEWVNYPDPKDSTKEKGRRTGKKERAGFGDVGFACQVMVQTYFDQENADSPFQMKVLKCTQNPRITGNLYGQIGDMRMNSFAVLAADVFPGTDIEKDWQ